MGCGARYCHDVGDADPKRLTQRRVGQYVPVSISPREGGEPPSLHSVHTVNQQLVIEDGRARVVTLLEVWDDRLVLRWVDFALAVASPGEVMRRQPEVVAFDDVGTQYVISSSGLGGGKDRMDGHATFQPGAPAHASEVRLEWPSGQETVVPLERE